MSKSLEKTITEFIAEYGFCTSPALLTLTQIEVSQQYASRIFKKLETEQRIKCIGAIGHKKYYVFYGSKTKLEQAIKFEAELRNVNSMLWLGDEMSPVEFLKELKELPIPAPNLPQFEWKSRIVPAIEKVIVGTRGGVTDEERDSLIVMLGDYADRLENLSKFIHRFVKNPAVLNGTVSNRLPDEAIHAFTFAYAREE